MAKIETFTEDDAKKTPEEVFNNIPFDDTVIVRDMPYDDKVRFFKYVMGYNGLVNTHLLTNVSLLVNGKDIADEVFEQDDCPFKSLEEYVDLKFDLKDEIKKYCEGLLIAFLSAIKSLASVLPDGRVDVPGSYRVILMSMNIIDIAKILNRTTELPMNSLYPIINPELIVNHFFAQPTSVVEDFIKYLMNVKLE